MRPPFRALCWWLSSRTHADHALQPRISAFTPAPQNCSRGYEWLVLQQAKLRNPAITTFGLSWGVPGWIGGGNYYSADNLEYHTSWLDCARNTWGIEIDMLGIWVRQRGGGEGVCGAIGACHRVLRLRRVTS